jgi:hypothetical protein
MILHVARNQISRVRDDLRPTAHMSLLDIRDSLPSQYMLCFPVRKEGKNIQP